MKRKSTQRKPLTMAQTTKRLAHAEAHLRRMKARENAAMLRMANLVLRVTRRARLAASDAHFAKTRVAWCKSDLRAATKRAAVKAAAKGAR